MSSSGSYHMTPDEFRWQGKAMIDWIATIMKKGN